MQRQGVHYAPDMLLEVDVQQSGGRMEVVPLADENEWRGPLGVGEWKRVTVKLRNVGLHDISEIWLVPGGADDNGSLWLDYSVTSGKLWRYSISLWLMCL